MFATLAKALVVLAAGSPDLLTEHLAPATRAWTLAGSAGSGGLTDALQQYCAATGRDLAVDTETERLLDGLPLGFEGAELRLSPEAATPMVEALLALHGLRCRPRPDGLLQLARPGEALDPLSVEPADLDRLRDHPAVWVSVSLSFQNLDTAILPAVLRPFLGDAVGGPSMSPVLDGLLLEGTGSDVARLARLLSALDGRPIARKAEPAPLGSPLHLGGSGDGVPTLLDAVRALAASTGSRLLLDPAVREALAERAVTLLGAPMIAPGAASDFVAVLLSSHGFELRSRQAPFGRLLEVQRPFLDGREPSRAHGLTVVAPDGLDDRVAAHASVALALSLERLDARMAPTTLRPLMQPRAGLGPILAGFGTSNVLMMAGPAGEVRRLRELVLSVEAGEPERLSAAVPLWPTPAEPLLVEAGDTLAELCERTFTAVGFSALIDPEGLARLSSTLVQFEGERLLEPDQVWPVLASQLAENGFGLSRRGHPEAPFLTLHLAEGSGPTGLDAWLDLAPEAVLELTREPALLVRTVVPTGSVQARSVVRASRAAHGPFQRFAELGDAHVVLSGPASSVALWTRALQLAVEGGEFDEEVWKRLLEAR